MNRLSKDDLAQMNKDYFDSLEKEKLVEVASNLHQLAVEQLEKLEQNSSNSSLPPSSDSFYLLGAATSSESLKDRPTVENDQTLDSKHEEKNVVKELKSKGFGVKKQGLQPGAKGFWRATPLVPTQTIPHYPETCAACNSLLPVALKTKPYMGYHVLELEKADSCIQVTCTLHHDYEVTCECGHHTKEIPGVGYVSAVEGRCKDLQLKEYTLVGPMLATFISSL